MKHLLPRQSPALVLLAVVLLCVQMACSLPFDIGSSAPEPTIDVAKIIPTEKSAPTLAKTDTPAAKAGTPTATRPTPAASTASAFPRYTLRADVASETLSVANTSDTAPADALQTVSAPGGVGFEGPFCSKNYDKPTLEGPSQVEVFSRFHAVLACGLQPNEKVTITVTLPDGTTTTEKAVFDASLNGGVSHFIEPKLGDLLGKYKLQFAGTGAPLTTTVEVVPPTQPGMEKLGEGQFFLHGFSPQEAVRLFAYQPSRDGSTFTLKGWREFKVDDKGELVVEDQILGSTLVLLDAKDEIFTASWGPPIPILRNAAENNCSGAPVTQLKPGGHAVVNTQQTGPNNLRTSPDAKAPIVGMINPGQGVTILDTPPVCASGYLWWNVRVDKSGEIGWTAEGGDGDYWLVP
jgi:hypothetical protein